ncbi:MAG TPA: cyclic nucleotide-binding domain-containing protein [bacterium]|nr:cyclic nucleotide-binding domain-containing protein [bacterium]
MKIPLINANAQLRRTVRRVLNAANRGAANDAQLALTPYELVPVDDQERAIEYINYQMPPLILMNFSDGSFDAFEVMRQITADPWLNHGGIIALYTGANTFNRINELKDSNIIIYLNYHDIGRQLGTVLDIIRSSQQILFQRALQTDLISSVSGQFLLTQDVLLVPAYANLVANYLFNVGFLDAESKVGVSLVLTEMLMNAIEHGNCGITFAEKHAHLARRGSIQSLIKGKCRDPAIRERRVHYSYDIRRDHSVHVIRDEGEGFDWRAHLDSDEIDYLAEHGRGILLARQNVEHIAYNDSGNEVTLRFRHRSGGTNIPGVLRDNEIVECKPDDVIIRQGDASDHLYYVAEGEYRVLVDGKHVANLTPADVLMGEMSMLLEETRSATVVASTPGRLIRISKEDFINIIKYQPYYGLFVSKLIAKRLYRLNRGRLS